MAVKGIPKSEKVWVTTETEKGKTFYITAKDDRQTYFLYENKDGKAVKIGQNKNPVTLANKYIK